MERMLRNGVCSINNISNEPKTFELVWFLCYCCVKMTSGWYKSTWRARCDSSRWGLRELIKQDKKLIVLELSFNEIDISPHPLSFFSDFTDLWGRDNHHISTPCRWKSTWVRLLKKKIPVAEALDLRDDDTPGPMWFVLTIQCNFVSSNSIQAILPLKLGFFFLFHLMYSVDCFFGGLLDPFNCFQSIGVLLPQYPVDFIIVSRALSALTFTRMFSK